MTLRYLRICADSKISTNLHTKTPPPQLLQLFLYLLLTHIQIKPTHGVLGFKETCQLRSNAKNISEPLPRSSRMQNRMRNVTLEKSQSGPAPTRWCTSTNSNEFTFSTMPESWQRHRPSKQINSTKSAAQPWVKKRRQWLAFSKQSAPMMT